MASSYRPWRGPTTPDALDAEYNLRSRHPERQQIYDVYSQRSQQTRSDFEAELDISYGMHQRSLVDLFPVHDAHAVLVFFHGGYWRALDKSIFSFLAAPFIEAGFAVAMPNYPLAPETPLDGIVDQARAAVTWVGHNRRRLGARANASIVVAGHSAGGHLAALCASTDWTSQGLESTLISGCVPISGLFDLDPLRHTNVATQVALTANEAHQLSPIHQPHTHRVPTLLIVGGDETNGFVWQSSAYHDHLAHHGAPVELRVEPCFNHFTILEPIADPNHDLFRQTTRLLAG